MGSTFLLAPQQVVTGVSIARAMEGISETDTAMNIMVTLPVLMEDLQHVTESTTPPFRNTQTPPHQQTRSGRKVTFPSNLCTDYYL